MIIDGIPLHLLAVGSEQNGCTARFTTYVRSERTSRPRTNPPFLPQQNAMSGKGICVVLIHVGNNARAQGIGMYSLTGHKLRFPLTPSPSG